MEYVILGIFSGGLFPSYRDPRVRGPRTGTETEMGVLQDKTRTCRDVDTGVVSIWDTEDSDESRDPKV